MDIAKVLENHVKWLNCKGGSRANLSEANLSLANLSEANLSRADLYGADLSEANLYGADLSEANLYGADLSRADLSLANLSRANLSRADLSLANLSRANLSRADLSRANLILAGQDQRGYLFYAYMVDNELIVHAGCRRLTLENAKAYWNERHMGDPVLHADCLSLVARIETMAIARGWIEESA